MTLQKSHDELAQQLCILLGQMVYGRHAPTRVQVLLAVQALRDACPLLIPRLDGLAQPTVQFCDEMAERVAPKRA